MIECFNPCFYGSYSFTSQFKDIISALIRCFNPCFYGSYSFTKMTVHICSITIPVLILVFMEVILLLNAFLHK